MTKMRGELSETGRRGDEIYNRVIKPKLRPEDDFKIVAIDVESEDYEIGEDDYATCELLKKRQPGAVLWVVRVGQPGVYKLGWRGTFKELP
jgi:hypothetical protein